MITFYCISLKHWGYSVVNYIGGVDVEHFVMVQIMEKNKQVSSHSIWFKVQCYLYDSSPE